MNSSFKRENQNFGFPMKVGGLASLNDSIGPKFMVSYVSLLYITVYQS